MKSRRTRFALITAVTVPVALLIALVSWGFASPVGASPDDDYHMASIWCGGGTDDLCQEGDAPGEMRVPETLIVSSGCFAFQPESSATCSVEPSMELISTDRGNFVGGYPPVFYWAMSAFSGEDVPASIVLMRAANAALFVGLISALFFALPRERRQPLVWGVAVTIVPLGMFLIPSVNPSSWAILSAATLWIALTQYLRSRERREQIVFGAISALATVIGAGARGDAAMYAGLAVVVALILSFERSARFFRLAILPLVLSVVAIVFFLTAGQSAVVAGTPNESGGSRLGLALANLVRLPELWSGALGTTGLGWLDTAMPGLVWVPAHVAFFAIVFWGLQRFGLRKGIAFGLVFLAVVVVPLYVLVSGGVMVGSGVQPRYIYPLLVMLAGVSVYGFMRADLRLNRVQIGLIAALLVVANAIALHTNLRRYVTGTDGDGLNLDAGMEWWWSSAVSPMGMWAIGSLSFAVAVAGLAVYAVNHSHTETRGLVQS